MNVNKILVWLVLIPIMGFSQKKEAVYFVLTNKHTDYAYEISGFTINSENSRNPDYAKQFNTYEREEYEKRVGEKKEDRLSGTDYWYKTYSQFHFLTFKVKNVKKVNIHCVNNLEFKNYKWIVNNTWKNPGSELSYKNLYFLIHIEGFQYWRYKVVRVVIAQ